MKVEGPGKSHKTSKTSKAKSSSGASGAEFAKLLEAAGETDAVQANPGAVPVQRIDAILRLQEDEGGGNSQEAHRRAAIRAEAILDELDKIRVGILYGVVNRQNILDLQKLVDVHKGAINDPQLAEILEEIDMRAQIELAKLDR